MNRWDRLVAAVESHGYTVYIVDDCHDAETPSPYPFPIADGLTDHARHKIKVRRKLLDRKRTRNFVLAHELAHVVYQDRNGMCVGTHPAEKRANEFARRIVRGETQPEDFFAMNSVHST